MTEPPSPPARGTPGSTLRRLAAVFDGALDTLLGLLLLVAVAAIFIQVVLRYGFARPNAWLDEFAVLVFAWLIFVGAAVAQRTDSHVSIDALVRLLPERVQRALGALRAATMAAILAILFWQGLRLTRELGAVEYPAMGVPRSFLYAALPATVPLFALYLVRSVGRRRRAARLAELEQ